MARLTVKAPRLWDSGGDARLVEADHFQAAARFMVTRKRNAVDGGLTEGTDVKRVRFAESAVDVPSEEAAVVGRKKRKAEEEIVSDGLLQKRQRLVHSGSEGGKGNQVVVCAKEGLGEQDRALVKREEGRRREETSNRTYGTPNPTGAIKCCTGYLWGKGWVP